METPVNGCKLCGISQDRHGNRSENFYGSHLWQEPSNDLRKKRIKERRGIMETIKLSEAEQSFIEKGLQEVTDGKVVSSSWFWSGEEIQSWKKEEEVENWPYWAGEGE